MRANQDASMMPRASCFLLCFPHLWPSLWPSRCECLLFCFDAWGSLLLLVLPQLHTFDSIRWVWCIPCLHACTKEARKDSLRSCQSEDAEHLRNSVEQAFRLSYAFQCAAWGGWWISPVQSPSSHDHCRSCMCYRILTASIIADHRVSRTWIKNYCVLRILFTGVDKNTCFQLVAQWQIVINHEMS